MENLQLQLKNGLPYPMGPSEQKEGINFAIFAREVDKLSLCFFDEHSLDQPMQEIELNPLHNKTGDVWHILVQGLPPLITYAYRVTRKGNDNPSYLLLDPYAKAVVSPSRWTDENENNYSYKPFGKVIPRDNFQWEGDKTLKIPKKDLVIYEMHVRGFTIDPSSQVKHPGTYRGIIEKIPYFLDLGINAIELMPIHEFYEGEVIHTNPETKKKLHNYFGYSTISFFSPMNRYASNSEGDQPLNEFKEMVKELHKNGIAVILDVVFNHTGEGNEKGPTWSFRGFDPAVYYMIDPEGHYLNFSGCGNTFNTNHWIVSRFILDVLHYWVIDMHVDGFRFDLTSILTRDENGAPLNPAPVVEAITKDPILADTLLIAEAWDPAGLYQLGYFASRKNRWSEWNGKYRDVVRDFIKGTPAQKQIFAGVICGTQEIYGAANSPLHSLNFITAHDGFSLHDLVSYNEKHNVLNGEENRDGLNENRSWNCGCEGPSKNKKIEILRKRQMRNFHLALMISCGIPMLLMGDEYGHSRNGNNNTWCQDNALNWFLWNDLEKSDFFSFYKFLIKFRRHHPLLTRETYVNEKDIKWHGINPDQPEWENDNRLIALTFHFPDGEAGLYVAFNAGHLEQKINIPPLSNNKQWFWVINTHNLPPNDFYTKETTKPVDKTTLHLSAYSAIMLMAGNNDF